MSRDWTNPFQDRSEYLRYPDVDRGRLAFREGKPFRETENIDWQLGWQSAQADARLDDEP